MQIKNIKFFYCKNFDVIAEQVKKRLVGQVLFKPRSVFCLATGSTPIPIYEAIIKDRKENYTDWSYVTTFNLDEYWGISNKHPQSYRVFMNENLFNHINISLANTHLPKGTGDVKKNINDYEQLIKLKGPFDICLLGVGVNGHIAFNEPGSSFEGTVDKVELTEETILVNAKKYFKGDSKKVPKFAISMGIGTILNNSRKIILVAYGETKFKAIQKLIIGKEDKKWPLTALLRHRDVEVYTDYNFENFSLNKQKE